MPNIYMGASRTFAYLGESSGESDTVLRNLARGIWTPPHLLESFFRRTLSLARLGCAGNRIVEAYHYDARRHRGKLDSRASG